MKTKTLADFVNPVRVWTHDRQWEAFVTWNRAGLLRVQPDPKFRDMATLVLTDKGRLKVEDGTA